jgi:uncharacterized protein
MSAIEVQTLEASPLDEHAEQVMAPMRDGVRLATDVYLPKQPGPYPAILVRLPYDKNGRYTFMPYLAPYVTERGYAFVVQDVRGKFRSEGETLPFVHEVEDGYDTLEWLASQPWSNGEVGMFGDSYYGLTQWAAVASGHPALKAMVPRVTSANLDILGFTTSWEDAIQPLWGPDYVAHFWVDRNIHEYPVDWSRRPLIEAWEAGLASIGTRSPGLDLILANQRQRGDFSTYQAGHPFDRLAIPVLHAVGWFDNIGPASMADYMELVSRPETARYQYLIADSTDHENYSLGDGPIAPEVDHDQNDAALARLMPKYLGPALDFFDAFLMRRTDPSGIPHVRWHLGHEGWHRSETWPPAGVHERRLYLGSAGEATRSPAGGALTATPEAAASEATWTHDPENLVPSAVMNPFAFLHEYPDETEIEGREDVATFTAAPFSEPLDLAGPISASLAVGSSATSMHLFVRLLDVSPEGSAHMIVHGECVVRDPRPDAPVRVDLSHTAYRVRPGHRLRLHIACSDFPLNLPHPGTEENPWLATSGERNTQRLLGGGASWVSLTVV